MMSATESGNSVFEQLEAYSWTSDAEFQSGLKAILGPDPSSLHADRLQDLTLHARCFYFSRKFDTSVDFESYRSWRESKTASELATVAIPDTAGEVADSQPLSFAEVMELVQTGQPVPGVKDIPDIVMEGKGTESSKPERSKPWETTHKKGSGLFDASTPQT